MVEKIEVGQVWRKLGPYDWIKVEQILDPRYPCYDGGLPGCSVRCYPPQLKGIQLRGGVCRFVGGDDWEEQVRRSRFLDPIIEKRLWRRGISIQTEAWKNKIGG